MAAALYPDDPVTARQWTDGQLLGVLHGRPSPAGPTTTSA
jgi:hypothetical protein